MDKKATDPILPEDGANAQERTYVRVTVKVPLELWRRAKVVAASLGPQASLQRVALEALEMFLEDRDAIEAE